MSWISHFGFPAGIFVPWSEPFPVEVSPDRMGMQGSLKLETDRKCLSSDAKQCVFPVTQSNDVPGLDPYTEIELPTEPFDVLGSFVVVQINRNFTIWVEAIV
jgi:hypothetical protein